MRPSPPAQAAPTPGGALSLTPTGAASDEELMERYARQGDRAAFRDLFDRYHGRLLGYFRRFVGGDPVAQDLVQQTFLQLHRARRDYRLGAPLRPWLYTIAANLRREHFRRRGRRPEVSMEERPGREPSSSPEVSSPEARLLRRALQELPQHEREVLVLHWFEGLSMAEVAEVLGASRSAVKVRAHRAYKKLKVLLEQGLPQAAAGATGGRS